MKKIILYAICVWWSSMLFAQAPAYFKYQAVVRGVNGELLADQNIILGIGILAGSTTGLPVYSEKHMVTSNQNGLVNITIGDGIEKFGNLDSIDWAKGPYFIKCEINGLTVSVSPLLSVPFALYAKTSGTGFSGNYDDLKNKPEFFSGNYNELNNRPHLFSGDYNDLKNKPEEKPVQSFITLSSPNGKLWDISVDDSGQIAIKEHLIDTSLVYDIDGNVYHKIKIGNQLWLKENLRTTRFRNGVDIQDGTGKGNYQWEDSPQYRFAYNDIEESRDTFGFLYTWYVAIDSSGVCPTGWDVPTDQDWSVLSVELGMNPLDTGLVWSLDNSVGNYLKQSGNMFWAYPNDGANDSTGFSALPAGYRSRMGDFSYKNEYACFWSKNSFNETYAWYRHLKNTFGAIGRTYNFKNYGFSIRCIRSK
ncbi:MAG: fibrobacter succinogenes major paralogous domain-containing protein [Bacteroidales bacterium]